MSPSNFITAVFDIEAKWYVPALLLFPGAYQKTSSAALEKRGQKNFQTLTEKASLQIKRNQLYHRMQMLLEVQSIYVPGAASLETQFAHESARDMGKKHDSSMTISK
jgi:hypothetical protein